jgi:hypothetical protein
MPTIFSRLLGETPDSPLVLEAIHHLGLHDIEEDPPFRSYIGSKKTGIDLLIEHDRVKAAQIFVKAMQGFSAFQSTLPYGLQSGMKRDEVHRLLGKPSASDEFDSQYENIEPGIKLVVNFDKSSEITYLNVTAKSSTTEG